MPVLRQNVYIVILFGRCGTGIILVFFLAPPLLQNGALNTMEWDNFANIAIYLKNGTR